jgi:hypothetical protein
MNVRRQHFNELEYDDIIDMELYTAADAKDWQVLHWQGKVLLEIRHFQVFLCSKRVCLYSKRKHTTNP